MKNKKISDAAIRRLPRYYHCLKNLENDGITKVSSTVISGLLNITASQVRQDFAGFGEFGQQGYGYDVEYLKNQIANLLGLTKTYSMVLIGAGNIGRALAGYKGFASEGFVIKAIFDKRPVKIDNFEVYDEKYLEEYLATNKVDICVVATELASAKECASRCVKCGIKAIWNFAQVDMYFGEDVVVQNVSMSDNLMLLAYRMQKSVET